MDAFEVFWAAYYCVLVTVCIAQVIWTLHGKGPLARTVLGWTALTGIPLLLIAALFFPDGGPSMSVDVGSIPGAFILMILLPVTMCVGVIALHKGNVRRNLTVTLLYSVITMVCCGMLCLAFSVVPIRHIGNPRIMVGISEIVIAVLVLYISRRYAVGRMKEFLRWDNGKVRGYMTTAAVLTVFVDLSYSSWLVEFGHESNTTILLCIGISLTFLMLVRMMLANVSDILETASRDAELDAARKLQQSVLPDAASLDWMLGFEAEAVMEPAKEVAGDFYDIFPTGEREVAFVVADVSDKGIPAALFMMRCRSVLRDRLLSTGDLGKAVSAANDSLCENNPSCMFVTAFIGKMDLDSGNMEYVNAGHIPPFIGDRRVTGGKGPMMGFSAYPYHSETVCLSDGDIVTAVTDGITESDSGEEFYGESRASRILSAASSPSEAVSSLTEDVRYFAGGIEQSDDLTVLSFRYRTTEHHVFDTGSCPEAVEWTGTRVPDYCSMRVQLVTEEHFLNAVGHGGAGFVAVTVRDDGDSCTVAFEDDGSPFDTTKGPGTKERGADEPGGKGLGLIRSFTDSLSYSRIHGTNVLVVGFERRL